MKLARATGVAILAGLVLGTAGCGSDNKGKIEGKWKVVDPGSNADAKSKDEYAQLSKMGLYIAMDYKADGSLTFGLDSEKPETLQLIKAMAPDKPTSWSAKYKLLSGDGVEIYDLPKDMQQKGGGALFGGKDRAKTKVKIDGDNMTMTDPDGTIMKLSRIK